MGFQNKVNRELGIAVQGDFASTNPRNVMLSQSGALIAGTDLTVGYFAFADLDFGVAFANYEPGRRPGFVHRNNQCRVEIGQTANITVLKGKESELFVAGDFCVTLDEPCNAGDEITASVINGKPSVMPVGANYVSTGYIAMETKPAGQSVKISRDLPVEQFPTFTISLVSKTSDSITIEWD